MVNDSHHTRRDLALIATAVRREWSVPDEVMASLPTEIVGVMRSARINGDSRVYLRCAEALQAMHRDNRDIYALLDRIERLDSGQATERIESSMTVEQSQAMARNLEGYAEFLTTRQ